MNLRDSLFQDAVQALRVLEPVSIGPDGSVGDAIALMRTRGEGCVIVEEHGKPVGILTERDILIRVLPETADLRTPIVDVMTSPPQLIREGLSVAEVIRTMHVGGFRHMPVVDGSGYLRGVVSVKRIVEYLVEHFPSTVFNLPPEPFQRLSTREGA